VIVIVLAFHSVLAYLASLPAAPYAFDLPPYRWQATPIIDPHRWFGFDLFCAWQDVSLMALMFLLSGIFVPASLRRKGSWVFLSDRFVRIGVPLAFVVAFIMPIAYYPAYRVSAADPGLEGFWRHWLALPFWSPGPQWFLWMLLALNVIAAGVHRLAPTWHERFSRQMTELGDRPVCFFLVLASISALAYIPLALAYTPWAWTNVGPFSFQLSRPLHYLVYFFAGYMIGAHGLDRGLIACDGPLARHWRGWLVAALIGFVLWALPTSKMLGDGDAPLLVQFASGLGYVIACAAGCLCFLALCLRWTQARVRLLDSLSDNAYNMYLIHYVFVVWLQFAVLPLALFALGKAAIVFAGTLAASWAVSVVLGNALASQQAAQVKRWLGASFSGLKAPAMIKQDD
jgi:hypothetical protein